MPCYRVFQSRPHHRSWIGNSNGGQCPPYSFGGSWWWGDVALRLDGSRGVVGSAHPTVVRVVGRPIVGWALPTKWKRLSYSKRSRSHETVQPIVGWALPTKWQVFQYPSGGQCPPYLRRQVARNGSMQLQKPGRHRFIQPGIADGGAHFNLPAAEYWAGSTYGVITSGLSSTA